MDKSNKEKIETEAIDREVFSTFFRENYCDIEYSQVKAEFEEIAAGGLEELFIDSADFSKINKKNFIIYLRSYIYGEFEAVVEEVFDSLNPEITDAVMDIGTTMQNQDEITESYWDKQATLLKIFLEQLFDEKIEAMLKQR